MASLGKWDTVLNGQSDSQNSNGQSLAFLRAHQNAGQSNATSVQGPSDFLRTLGYGIVPDAGAAIQHAGQATGNLINGLLGRGQAPTQNDFQTPEQAQGFSTPQVAAVNTAKDVGGAVATQAAGELTGAALGKLLPFLTKGGVGAKIGQAYQKATASGVTDSWPDFVTEARQAVAKKLGNASHYQDILNQKLMPEAPASLDASPQITPSQIFDLKHQASNRLPQGFLSQFQGKSAGNQVDEIIRDVAAKRGIDITPGVKGLNKLYQAYSVVGSPAKLAGNFAISKLVPDEWKQSLGGDLGVTGGLSVLENLFRIGKGI